MTTKKVAKKKAPVSPKVKAAAVADPPIEIPSSDRVEDFAKAQKVLAQWYEWADHLVHKKQYSGQAPWQETRELIEK
jgi:hypothetical protein